MATNPPSIELTDKLVSERLELLTKAALNGGSNAMTAAAKKARDGELPNISATGSESTIQANKATIKNWLPSQQKMLAEGKDPNAKKTGMLETIKSFWNDGILSAIMTFVGDSKIALLAESAVESFTNKDKNKGFSAILSEKTQEHKIRTFAEKHGIDGDRLLAEIKNPPPETINLARETPAEQKAKLDAAETARVAEEKQRIKAAEEAEIARQVRLTEEVEKARRKIQVSGATSVNAPPPSSQADLPPIKTKGAPQKG